MNSECTRRVHRVHVSTPPSLELSVYAIRTVLREGEKGERKSILRFGFLSEKLNSVLV